MNKLKRLGLLFILLTGVTPGFSTAMAQQPAVQFPTGYAAWTVDVTTHNPAPRPPAAPSASSGPGNLPTPPPVQHELKKMEITQTDNLYRSVLIWSDGQRTEVWSLKSPPWTLMDNPEGSGGIFLTALPHLLPFPRPDAMMFSWVNDRTYDSNGPYHGKMCMIYRKSMPLENRPPKSITGIEPTPMPHMAWIDEKTALPVALDNGESLYVFTFQPPPKTPLTLPARFQEELTRAQNSIPNPKYLGKPRSWAKP